MIILVDNYDSFTYNLAQYIGTFTDLKVIRNDVENLAAEIDKADGVVFSPGPGWPKDAGKLEALIGQFYQTKPMLGICLGHQAIAEVFGGQLTLAHETRHGKESFAEKITETAILDGVEQAFTVMRYHSIVVEGTHIPEQFVVTSRALDDSEIMSIEHESLPIYGLQFHPESIGTPDGLKMIENFVKIVEKNKVGLN
ncbi:MULTISPECIES: aminodeoxychorismate/anthranilate synthase component II [unclassified Enterococcus]|uniref:aminodeoxychorismate/anthranilate synthase component II n=1 Tax=unclassified Enterococcus TaxID=2608891 RepID=UPI001555E7DF|nr:MULTISPECIES: aminodeoxychorismate/anthranilate synthase component II [unclassified Enterococcus]MBS7577422.1 aminodeoxychorismate/anthranilate synthase component II [Enterococcus sp. MMGLQ5-2]MBS7584829.1 aminodeoxychorismate/anthranilate synthase component II [Enterococcus sp. MMGLQ5-1]NPD12684.1 aminodeoxychorismate/anthranilate synthase component II [Enterococcus sp. MMGLQ5-1]NPD37256.1 aminodeoxychorismate/anthranilate synthase component II [Enterococcus sp. MMGLQ5-2]